MHRRTDFLFESSLAFQLLLLPQPQTNRKSISYYPVSQSKRKIKKPALSQQIRKNNQIYRDIRKEFSNCIKIRGIRKEDGLQLYRWKLGQVKAQLTISDALKKGFQIYIRQLEDYKNKFRIPVFASKVIKSSAVKIPLFQPQIQSIKREENRFEDKTAEDQSFKEGLKQIFMSVVTKKYIRFQKVKAKKKQSSKDVVQISSQSDYQSGSDDSQSDYYPEPNELNSMIKDINASFNEKIPPSNQSSISRDTFLKNQLKSQNKPISKREKQQILNFVPKQKIFKPSKKHSRRKQTPLDTTLEKEFHSFANQYRLSEMDQFFGQMIRHQKPLACQSGLGLRSNQSARFITPEEFKRSVEQKKHLKFETRI